MTAYPTRPVVVASSGLVVCPHHLASQAGLSILQQGGNAIDAAIATNAALGVVYPHMTGLGGDAFWLVHHGASGQIYGLNGSGRSAQAASQERYLQSGLTSIPQRGPLAAVTVPGAVDSWWQAHQRWGQLPWAQVLQPAIDLAQQGYPASASQCRWTRRDAAALMRYSGTSSPFLPAGEVPKLGQQLVNSDLATTLQRLAAGGRDEFYKGAIAAQITAHLQTIGGLLTLADFAQHTSDWVDPITTSYRGYTVCELPPNSQGFALLQILNLIEPFDLQQLGHGTADYYHLLVEATKLAFADRDQWLGDPAFIEIPVAELISKEYCDRRRAQINLTQAQPYLPGSVGGDTAYSAFVDNQGNAVSLIQSLYFDFGSAVVPPSTGIVLQNRAHCFSLDPSHPNSLAPNKRSFHTLMPGLVLHPDGSPHLVIGTMGGEGQPQTQAALLTRILDFGFDPQTAIDLPRWVWGRTWGDASIQLNLEGRIPPEVVKTLSSQGHHVNQVPDWTDQMGHAHLILTDPESGRFYGGCDPRSDGIALGW
ncbi:gamma-glutamyltransferase [Pseudanabaena sp. FACHB-2040]|uniref:gamma-glutamyltransferase n=1 Tax=Pseudanabaena sp. FACHB-2040 TaxID=2692859 RepID=UPI0016834719|nr:gamma-glutamyltransferase [Pseudanabaena sp. FACHB-2040]MBD2256129.1 gamma-glutamyltransferase [Pseudanabaena sp. FACHB-2040]